MYKNNRKTIVIFGSGRTGTSMISKMLHYSGVCMGRDPNWAHDNSKPYYPKYGLIPRNQYYEDKAFAKLNIEILTMARGGYSPHWSQIQNIPIEKLRVVGHSIDYQKRIQKLVKKRNEEDNIWGWKDPRALIMTEFYLPHIINPYLIVTHRNLYAIAQSNLNRDNIRIEENIFTTLYYYTQGMTLLKRGDWPRIHLSYEKFITDETEWSRLCDHIGIPCNMELYQDFIRQSLQHWQ